MKDTLIYNPTSTLPWTQITEHLNSKYQILGTFDLSDFDHDMENLYVELSKVKLTKYSPTQKIVLYYYETDFYLSGKSFLLYNLQQILCKLDIPQFAVIMLSAHYGIDREVHTLAKQICNDSTKMNIWTSSYVQVLANPSAPLNNNSNVDTIKYPFICLNGTQRTHRLMFLCLLDYLNLVEQGIVTWYFSSNNIKNNRIQRQKNSLNYDSGCLFLTTVPHSRINDHVTWSNALHEVFQSHALKFKGTSRSHPEVSPYSIDCTVEEHFAKSFLYVITETVYDYPNRLLTEKIFKGFINRRPFIVVGTPHTLKQLRDLGFKTFDSIIDESYDDIFDPSDRLMALGKIVKDITSKPIEVLKEMCYSIEDILEYNHNYYHDNFCKVDLIRKLKSL